MFEMMYIASCANEDVWQWLFKWARSTSARRPVPTLPSSQPPGRAHHSHAVHRGLLAHESRHAAALSCKFLRPSTNTQSWTTNKQRSAWCLITIGEPARATICDARFVFVNAVLQVPLQHEGYRLSTAVTHAHISAMLRGSEP